MTETSAPQVSLPPNIHPDSNGGSLPPELEQTLPSDHSHTLPPPPPLHPILLAPSLVKALPASTRPRHTPSPRIIFAIFITIAILVIIILSTLQTFSATDTPTSPPPLPISLASPSPSPSATFYHHPDFPFTLNLPSTTTYSEIYIPETNTLTLTIKPIDASLFQLQVTSTHSETDLYTYQGTLSQSQRIIAGHLWQTFFIPHYTDQADSGGFALKLFQSPFLYTVIFPEESDTSSIADQILASFKLVSSSE